MKKLLCLILALCISICAGGCTSNHDNGDLKGNIIDGWNRLVQSFGKYALTNPHDLQGQKDAGADDYTGTYTASYNGFHGKEILFGGTALNRENGSRLKITYTLTVESGTAELYWISGNNEIAIASTNEEGTMDYTVSSGDNFIALKGENFTGSLELTVADPE